ncbi:MAG: hypothetical protein S0880_05820 [Actinomycetota bacterium]|nr:hypothetical protein [Actinomycetota bacterium]
MLRRRRERDPLEHVRPELAPARWRGAVDRALAHRAQFTAVRDRLGHGPFRDRLGELAERVDAGVLATWDLVGRADVAERTVASLDPRRAMDELKAARRRLAAATDAGRDTGGLTEQVEALAQRHASVQRLQNSVEDVDGRLRLLDARLGAVVARAAELAAGAGRTDGLDRALVELDETTHELEATRRAFEELGP